MFDSSDTNDVLLPVGRSQIGIADWISGMIHLIVSHIDSYMGYIVAGIVGGMEKDQIASLDVYKRQIFIFLLTGMMLFSQILFIIYAMFLPISFLLSMIPTYENMAKQAVVRVFNAIMTRAGDVYKRQDYWSVKLRIPHFEHKLVVIY